MTKEIEAKALPAPPPEKKRKHYQQKECPYCKAMVGNLGNHVRMKHPAEAAQDGIKPKTLTKETLLGTEPALEPRAQEILKSKKYYCLTCRAVLRKGENPCWQCGATLVWEGIE